MLRTSKISLILILFIILVLLFIKVVHKYQNPSILATIGSDHITVDNFIKSYSVGSSKLKPQKKEENTL